MNQFICGVCGKDKTCTSEGATGYGIRPDGKKVCYECCADEDREWMRTHDRTTLYLTVSTSPYGVPMGTVSNWPGSLKFKVGYVQTGQHNIAGKRYDVWFSGPDDTRWWGVQYGDNTQILHCRKVKGR
jgi:3D (Asp-Asp-Asp) domain-containing protein